MTELLNQLPNGGAVVAIIVVVVLFLKKQERSDETVTAIVNAFTSETVSARKEYREHVSEIMRLGLTAHQETRDAIRSLDEAFGELRKPRAAPKGPTG